MAKKRQPTSINIDKNPGQIQATGGPLPNYLTSFQPFWGNPVGLFNADIWRAWVMKQPVAILCRDALTNHALSLDWNITARDSEQQDELKEEINHYKKLLECGNPSYYSLDFTNHVEWLVKDLYDLPFGAASEKGREYNSPEGKVMWVKPIDGGTLGPTLDFDYPIAQYFPNYQPVVFPKEYISRIYLSPRTEIHREGWGMAPPEKIYLAMEMLNRGDVYYSKLLLNTPEAGILDLMDMAEDSARKWVEDMKDMFYGINPLKIPVLYEHTSEAKWIPFGKNPADIMYDSVTARYIHIVCAGYGLTPSDIGLGGGTNNGGETLAGSIRQERQSARSGKSLVKKKLKAYFDSILPETLQFSWIDFDDEKQVSTSRARMGSATAIDLFVANQIITPDEARRQIIADGLMTISIPETIDRSQIEWPTNALRYIGNKSGEQKGSNEVGSPQKPSLGGQGDVKPQQILQRSKAKIEVALSKYVYKANQYFGKLIKELDGMNWLDDVEGSLTNKSMMDLVYENILDETFTSLSQDIGTSEWLDTVSVEILKHMHENGSIENFNEKVIQLKTIIMTEFIPKIIMLSAQEKRGFEKYNLDLTDITDNNNLRLARIIAEKAYLELSAIVNKIILGEK